MAQPTRSMDVTHILVVFTMFVVTTGKGGFSVEFGLVGEYADVIIRGGSATLRCTVTADVAMGPAINLSLYHEGEEIYDSEDPSSNINNPGPVFQSSPNSIQLEIEEVRSDNEGNYTCRAQTQLHNVTDSFILNGEVDWPQCISRCKGAKIVYRCYALFFSGLKMTWYRTPVVGSHRQFGNFSIVDRDPILIGTSDNYTIGREDNATYGCLLSCQSCQCTFPMIVCNVDDTTQTSLNTRVSQNAEPTITYSLGPTSFPSGPTLPTETSEDGEKLLSMQIVIVVIALGITIVCLVVILVCCYIKSRHSADVNQKNPGSHRGRQACAIPNTSPNYTTIQGVVNGTVDVEDKGKADDDTEKRHDHDHNAKQPEADVKNIRAEDHPGDGEYASVDRLKYDEILELDGSVCSNARNGERITAVSEVFAANGVLEITNKHIKKDEHGSENDDEYASIDERQYEGITNGAAAVSHSHCREREEESTRSGEASVADAMATIHEDEVTDGDEKQSPEKSQLGYGGQNYAVVKKPKVKGAAGEDTPESDHQYDEPGAPPGEHSHVDLEGDPQYDSVSFRADGGLVREDVGPEKTPEEGMIDNPAYEGLGESRGNAENAVPGDHQSREEGTIYSLVYESTGDVAQN